MPTIITHSGKSMKPIEEGGGIDPAKDYLGLVAMLIELVKEVMSPAGCLIVDGNKIQAGAMTIYVPATVNIPALLDAISSYAKSLGATTRTRSEGAAYPNHLLKEVTVSNTLFHCCNKGESVDKGNKAVVIFAGSFECNIPPLSGENDSGYGRFIVYLAKVHEYPTSIENMHPGECITKVHFGYIIDDANFTVYGKEGENSKIRVDSFKYMRDVRAASKMRVNTVIPVVIGRRKIPLGLAYPAEEETVAINQREIQAWAYKLGEVDPHQKFARPLYDADPTGYPPNGVTNIRKGTWKEVLPYIYNPTGKVDHCTECDELLFGEVYVGLIRLGVVEVNRGYAYCASCAHDASKFTNSFCNRFKVVMRVMHPRTYEDELRSRTDLDDFARNFMLEMLNGTRKALYEESFDTHRYHNEHKGRYEVTLVDFGDGYVGVTKLHSVMTSELCRHPMIANAKHLFQILPVAEHYSQII